MLACLVSLQFVPQKVKVIYLISHFLGVSSLWASNGYAFIIELVLHCICTSSIHWYKITIFCLSSKKEIKSSSPRLYCGTAKGR